MKTFLLVILLTSSVVSANDNSLMLQKAVSVSNEIDHGQSLKNILNEINSNTFNPMFYVDDSQSGQRIYKPSSNISPLFNRVVRSRMSIEDNDSMVGSQEENLDFLKLLIKKGFNSNTYQPVYVYGISSDYIQYPIFVASKACSIPVVNLLLQNGADASVDNRSWSGAYYTSLVQDEGKKKLDCQIIAEFMLSKAKTIATLDIYKQFGKGDPTSDKSASWIGGDVISENYSPQILDIIKNRFGVKFSKRPVSDEPSDQWFEQFRKHLERPLMNGNYDVLKWEDFARAWFNSQSEDLKSWACYYSTFDEAVDLLVLDGNDEDLMSTCPAPGQPSGPLRCNGTWAVKEFRSFCKSIK